MLVTLDIAEVIARLERAESPNRWLDRDVALVIGWRRSDADPLPPEYTSSLDAALTLLPEHSIWSVGWAESGHFSNVLLPKGDGWLGSNQSHALAVSPVVALCIAALKARAGVP